MRERVADSIVMVVAVPLMWTLFVNEYRYWVLRNASDQTLLVLLLLVPLLPGRLVDDRMSPDLAVGPMHG
jgi:hypothetical protein